ncbi:MAG: hypothetical protein AB2A00_10710 [Myxococcota bacterium]
MDSPMSVPCATPCRGLPGSRRSCRRHARRSGGRAGNFTALVTNPVLLLERGIATRAICAYAGANRVNRRWTFASTPQPARGLRRHRARRESVPVTSTEPHLPTQGKPANARGMGAARPIIVVILVAAGCLAEDPASLDRSPSLLTSEPERLGFGSHMVGSRVTQALVLRNHGATEVQVSRTLLEGDAAFALESATETVPGGGTVSLHVWFAPDAPGERTASLRMETSSGHCTVNWTPSVAEPVMFSSSTKQPRCRRFATGSTERRSAWPTVSPTSRETPGVMDPVDHFRRNSFVRPLFFPAR